MSEKNARVESIDITPDKSLMPKLGCSGYSISEAIAELVDNSIDAALPEKKLSVLITLSQDEFVIEDNARGMNKKTAADSIRLAHSTKKNQKGEFGLGLKTSCLSLGSKFTIMTTSQDAKEVYNIVYDEKDWMSNDEWRHDMQVISKTDELPGTKVIIEKLKIKYYPNFATTLKEELGTRFAPEIEAGHIEIKVNTKWCQPIPIELTEEGKSPFELTLPSGNKIHGWVGLLKVGSNKGNYGFNTFRRGRLITKFDKIGFTPHPEVRQIIGELHLDHVPVTHNKREFIKESALYQEVLDEMEEVMRPWVKKARDTNQNNSVDQKTKEKMDVQLQNIARAINKTLELREYATPNSVDGHNDGSEVTPTQSSQLMEIEKREQSVEPIIQVHEEPLTEKERMPKKTHMKRRYSILINGKRFKFKHEFRDFKDPSFMKAKMVTEQEGIEIFTNTAFPAFLATKDCVFYATFHIAEAIAEVMTDQKQQPASKVPEIRDLILKQTAQIMRDLDEADRLDNEMKEHERKVEEIRAQKAKLEV